MKDVRVNETTEELKKESYAAAGTQLTFGAFTGLISGYAIRQGAKVAAVVLGTGFVFIQGLSYLGYVDVNWRKFERMYHHVLDRDGDGKVTANDFKILFDDTSELLKFNLPSGAGFTAGFGYGLTRSYRFAAALPIVYGITVSYALGGFPSDLFGEAERFGFSPANDWFRINGVQDKFGNPFSDSTPPSTRETMQKYLKTKSLAELLRLEKSLSNNEDVRMVDPVFSLLKYNNSTDNVILKDVITEIKQEKFNTVKNTLRGWLRY